MLSCGVVRFEITNTSSLTCGGLLLRPTQGTCVHREQSYWIGEHTRWGRCRVPPLHLARASPFNSRLLHTAAQSAHRPVVCTSEFWYDDEEEFDAVKDVLAPKRIFLVVNPTNTLEMDLLRSELSHVRFDAAFTSQQASEGAAALWRDRGGPPFFLKMRSRESLTELEKDESCLTSAPAADNLWTELCEQNWRVELDYGLPGSSASEQLPESILVVCGATARNALLEYSGIDLKGIASDGEGARGGDSAVCILVAGSEGLDSGNTWRSLPMQLTAWQGQL